MNEGRPTFSTQFGRHSMDRAQLDYLAECVQAALRLQSDVIRTPTEIVQQDYGYLSVAEQNYIIEQVI